MSEQTSQAQPEAAFVPRLPTSVLPPAQAGGLGGLAALRPAMYLPRPQDRLTFEKKYQILTEMGTGVYGTVYKVKQKAQRQSIQIDTGEPKFYAAKKLFQQNGAKMQQEILARQPEHTRDRYREIFEKDNSLNVRRLKTATSKMFIRERQILQQLPPHPNIVMLLEVISQPLKESIMMPVEPQSGCQLSRQVTLSSQNLQQVSQLPFMALAAQQQTLQIPQMQQMVQGSPNLRPQRRTREVPNRFTEYLIFEFAEHELAAILASKISFEERHVKCLMKQILSGLAHLEKNDVLHRDMKPANILLNRDGILKIVDFGLARHKDQSHLREERKQYTPKLTTPLYRAPECFLGAQIYSSKVDVWAAGLICYELLTKQPLFPTDNGELGIVLGIFNIFGAPNENSWPGVSNLDTYKAILPRLQQERGYVQQPRGLRAMFPANSTVSASCLDFLDGLLTLCPERRLSASDALEHPYLVTQEPAPCQPNELPRFECEMSQKFAKKQTILIKTVQASSIQQMPGANSNTTPPPKQANRAQTLNKFQENSDSANANGRPNHYSPVNTKAILQLSSPVGIRNRTSSFSQSPRKPHVTNPAPSAGPAASKSSILGKRRRHRSKSFAVHPSTSHQPDVVREQMKPTETQPLLVNPMRREISAPQPILQKGSSLSSSQQSLPTKRSRIQSFQVQIGGTGEQQSIQQQEPSNEIPSNQKQ